ncbi:hypothetical protein [Tenacibaculum finnmarkense]|uniref:Lipoprotein n=1 Tax=Tenacibaculum finnmarkense genomovar finnmarkense TaxID=1458503 RepID=A0AAP1RH33_9FLAO|nr:hypothetical protein [Tenacibaculum finnmarkense]MBE7653907.1 hypothetical protein [Tenacibaculum finnmarkense genomovar finnmarkense]MBE7696209.1 hypothetical protein [Tenacibaculum finnmarkense genomovar finnmarkense]MCD8428435.1 hypothetical protein [Tenacibaculum finnmarkense genomovar finnmarkense]MCD8440827.1 hypothetical protein [Tenacibaculum finnmarkense genomovar ulcerans]MCG8721735.1 hypothetical protein [Tenacibaculum finnmarkense]
MINVLKTSKLLLLIVVVVVSCKNKKETTTINKSKTSIIQPKNIVEINNKKALRINIKFDSLEKKIIKYQDINWDNIALDSLMILDIKTSYRGLKSIKIKRPVYRGDSPFSFELFKNKKNINLIIREEGNTVLIDSLIFLKEHDSYFINEIYNIQLSHIKSRTCTSKIKIKNSYLMVYDSSEEINCIEEKK